MANRTPTAYGVYLMPPATLFFMQKVHPWTFCKRHDEQKPVMSSKLHCV